MQQLAVDDGVVLCEPMLRLLFERELLLVVEVDRSRLEESLKAQGVTASDAGQHTRPHAF